MSMDFMRDVRWDDRTLDQRAGDMKAAAMAVFAGSSLDLDEAAKDALGQVVSDAIVEAVKAGNLEVSQFARPGQRVAKP